MSNEELAVLIQSGRRDLLPELWAGVARLARNQARRWAAAVGWQSGTEAEDFLQAAFLALLAAVDSFDPEAGGPFTAWFILAMKREFAAAAGIRTRREQADPLRGAASLDAPASPDAPEDLSLGDLVPDPAAEAAFEDVAEADRRRQLREALETALSALPEDQRRAIRGKYCYGRTVDRKAHAAALRALRHPGISRQLKVFWQMAE